MLPNFLVPVMRQRCSGWIEVFILFLVEQPVANWRDQGDMRSQHVPAFHTLFVRYGDE